MLNGFYLYDSDAHTITSPRMWQDLPSEYHARRPRPVEIGDPEGLGGFDRSWLVDGQLVPHPFGPAAQAGNTPAGNLIPFPGTSHNIHLSPGSDDLSNPEARLKDLDHLGVDTSVMFPSTIYARLTTDPGLENALFRSYNRYVGEACQSSPKRLKWVGLVPLRDPQGACEALREMKALGARGALVWATVGDKLLSDPMFSPFFDELERSGLPLCTHFGMSYRPFDDLCRAMYAGHIVGLSFPVLLAFYAVTAGGLMDRYPKLKIGFFEFATEWLLYAVPRMDQYRDLAVENGVPWTNDVPKKRIIEYVRCGNIFLSGEGDGEMLPHEMRMFGEDIYMYSSDFPHAEMRENTATEVIERNDLTDKQKRKLLSENARQFFGEP
jgi:predicted TIM-barrel fold metal-dependent hydrolase